MAVSCRIQSKNIKIYRQGGSDNFFVSWALTSAQKKRKISRYVYSTSKKKKVKTTKKFPDVIDSYTVKWYYRSSKGGTWYLDKTISDLKVRSTSHDLWSPPPEARELRVSVRPIAKTYKTNKSGSTARWFSVDSTLKIDSDYDEYPQTPSIGEFSIDNKTLKAQVIVDLTNFDRLETSAVRLQVYRNGNTLLRFTGSTQTTGKGEYYIEKKFTKSNPIPSSGIVNFTGIKLSTASSYQVRGAVASYDGTNAQSGSYKWSEYSAWSSSIDARPNAPTLKKVEAVAADQVKVTWSSITNITKYEIEYASDNKSFTSGTYQTASVEDTTTHIISGLESGHTWYFRVRSVNDSDKSSPSKILSTVLAVKPSPPTTWSSVNVASIKAMIEDTNPLYLYWTHNSADGSAERYAKFVFTINGTKYYRTIINGDKDEYGDYIDVVSDVNFWTWELYTDEANTTLAGTGYDLFRASGAEAFKWKVRTRGVSTEYSDFSIERTIEVYEDPNLQLMISDANGEITGDTFVSFPLTVAGTVTPSSQIPISFHISIIAGGSYTTTDIYGNEIMVSEGTEIYSKYIDDSILDTTITSADVDFFTDVPYELKVVAYTDAGLNASASRQLEADWEEIGETPDATIDFNETFRYATIRPYCMHFIGYENDDEEGLEDYDPVCYVGTSSPETVASDATSGDMYFNTSTNEVYSYGPDAWNYKTTFDYSDALSWYSGTDIDGETDDDIYPNSGISQSEVNDHYINTATGDIFRCVKSGEPDVAIWEYLWNCFWEVTPNIELAIYRKEPGGGYVTIAEEIDNSVQSSDSAVTFRDPHPSFNSCVYRIVARNTENGAIGYTDLTEALPESSVVIQWDETWNDVIENENGEEFEGSILELPANIKLSDSNNMDVNFAEYIGRARPVAYYGTQKGEKPSINCEFDKKDAEKLALLRQLMNYSGNVYIREPSGLGYWANVAVSYNRDYSDLTIPVTLSITPVEGGI